LCGQLTNLAVGATLNFFDTVEDLRDFTEGIVIYFFGVFGGLSLCIRIAGSLAYLVTEAWKKHIRLPSSYTQVPSHPDSSTNRSPGVQDTPGETARNLDEQQPYLESDPLDLQRPTEILERNASCSPHVSQSSPLSIAESVDTRAPTISAHWQSEAIPFTKKE